MKKIITFLIIIILSGSAWFYFGQDKEVAKSIVKEKVAEQEENIDTEDLARCPNDDYSWEKLHFVDKDEIIIECKVNSDNKIILVAKKNDEGLLRYQVFLEYNDEIISLGSYPVFTIGEVQFDIMSKSLNDVIHIYDKQRDGSGLTEGGWFVNFKNQKHVKYWTNGQELIIYSDNTTNTIKYFIDKKNSALEESMISGVYLNDEQVIKFDKPIILKRDISNEIAPYSVPDLKIISFNSSLNIVTIYNKEIGEIDIIF